MIASGFLTKLAENDCEENHFSVDFSQKFLRNLGNFLEIIS